MNETTSVCDRCGAPIVRTTARVLIESGPLHEAFPKLDLCGHCSESLEHWLAKRRVELRGGLGSRPEGPLPAPPGRPVSAAFHAATPLGALGGTNDGVRQALLVLAMSVAALGVLLATMSLID